MFYLKNIDIVGILYLNDFIFKSTFDLPQLCYFFDQLHFL